MTIVDNVINTICFIVYFFTYVHPIQSARVVQGRALLSEIVCKGVCKEKAEVRNTYYVDIDKPQTWRDRGLILPGKETFTK